LEQILKISKLSVFRQNLCQLRQLVLEPCRLA
jgi:hypothetical protein